MRTIPQKIKSVAEQSPGAIAQYRKDATGQFRPVTYGDLARQFQAFAAGLLELGVKRGDHVGIVSDTRAEWIIADLGILSLGACDVPRGADTPMSLLIHSLGQGDCRFAVVEDMFQVRRLLADHEKIKKIEALIVFDAGSVASKTIPVYSFEALIKRGFEALQEDPEKVNREMMMGDSKDRATILFTTGSTGASKGVALTHAGFLNQIEYTPRRIDIEKGEIWLSVAPIWHSAERATQYVALGNGCSVAYSSPIGKVLMADFKSIRPHWILGFPRLWMALQESVFRQAEKRGKLHKLLFGFFISIGTMYQLGRARRQGLIPRFKWTGFRLFEFLIGSLQTLILSLPYALGNLLVYRKIRALFGNRFKAAITGGVALPFSVERFFMTINVPLLDGYGLTETSPVIAVRPLWRPVIGTVGPPLEAIELKIVNRQGNPQPRGEVGRIMVRGSQIMQGYYKNEAETRRVIDANGWFDTEDLGRLTKDGFLQIVGRVKDTIVLLGGDNVEPLPIEEALSRSKFIRRAVAVGQNQKYIGALIVPDFDLLETYAMRHGIPYLGIEDLLNHDRIRERFAVEIRQHVNTTNGFPKVAQVARFVLLSRDFEVGRELSIKLGIKRHVIPTLYAKKIEELF